MEKKEIINTTWRDNYLILLGRYQKLKRLITFIILILLVFLSFNAYVLYQGLKPSYLNPLIPESTFKTDPRCSLFKDGLYICTDESKYSKSILREMLKPPSNEKPNTSGVKFL